MGDSMPSRDKILRYLYTWATNRVPMDKSKVAIEEVFLWGVQTSQRMNGVERKSTKFTMDAELILGKKGRSVLGWRLKSKDCSYEFIRYEGNLDGELLLKPVTKSRQKRSTRSKKVKQRHTDVDGAGALFQ
jgi:hypothetical protein